MLWLPSNWEETKAWGVEGQSPPHRPEAQSQFGPELASVRLAVHTVHYFLLAE